jgi:PAS domain S-box-containing protein
MQVAQAVGSGRLVASGHLVQFYDGEAELAGELARFFQPVRDGQACGFAIATPGHRALVAAAAPGAEAVDARATLDAILADGWPDPARFEAVVGAPLRRLVAGGQAVCAFGEMVALLCQEGRPDAALALERIWNRFADETGIRLLCAYPVGAFSPGALSEAIAEHARVLAAAPAPAAPQDAASLLRAEQERRQELERALAAREAELRDFVLNGPDGMHQVDEDGTILWVNQAELDLLGYERHEYVGRRIQSFHEDQAAVDGIFEALRRGEPVLSRPARLRCKDGSLRDVLISSNAVHRDGRMWRSRCIVRDATDLARAQRDREEALRRVEERERELRARELQQAAVARLGREALAQRDLGALFGAAVRELAATLGVEYAGLLELDPDRHHLTFRAGHGWRPGLIGKASVPAGPGSQAGYVLSSRGPLVYHGLAGETRFEPSALLLGHGCHSGMVVAVETAAGAFGTLGAHTVAPRRFTQDDANFLAAVAHVLAGAIERRAFEDEMQRSRARLEETVAERTRQLAASNRELEAFSYSVSHDLRAPLRTISGYTSLLEAKHASELGPEARLLLEGVRKGADRLGRLIDDLLDLSRVQRVDLVRQAVDLSALARQRLRELAAAEPDRQVEVRVESGLRATGDPRLLGMLLDNLLGNAWKFTRHSARGRIEVGRQGTQEDAVFFVKDNGAGFDMAYAGRLFQPFQRLHRPSEFEGTGVGLATVQRIVDRHGGHVWAEGRVGEGAAFYFTLGGLPAEEPPKVAPAAGP